MPPSLASGPPVMRISLVADVVPLVLAVQFLPLLLVGAAVAGEKEEKHGA